MTAFIVLTLRLLLGLMTWKFFLYLAPIASFFLAGYEQLTYQSYFNFFAVFGEAFFTFFVVAYILFPIIFDALNQNLDKNTLIVIGVKLGFLLIFCLLINLLGLSVFIVTTDWIWIGLLYGYIIFLYFGILGELKPVLFLEEPRYFLIDLREKSSPKLWLQFLVLFVSLSIISWNFTNESAIAQAQETLRSYLNSR